MSSVIHSFQHFLERIMPDTLEEHGGEGSKGGRNVTNMRVDEDIDAPAKEEQELEAIDESNHLL